MFGISFAELAVIVLLILVVMGPEKIPEVARMAGKGMRELRQASNALRDALMIDEISNPRRLIDSPPKPPQASPPSASATPEQHASTPKPQPQSEPEASLPQAQSASRPGLTGIDQMDPDEFDRFLEEQYQLHHKELLLVPLPLQKTGESLRAVPLAAASPIDGPQSVSLAYSLAHELAS